MRDINILINKDHTLTFPNDYAGLQEENLQGNITFSFDEFVQGKARAEVIINNESGYIELEQVNETYVLPIKASLLTSDFIIMQLVIDEPAIYNLTTDTSIVDGKTYYQKVGDEYIVVTNPVEEDLSTYYVASIPVWKSETFTLKVGFSINATTTIPEDYPSWVEIIDELVIETEKAIAKASNVNISSEQLTNGVKVITTNRDGVETETIVPQGPQGEPGVPGAVKFLIVNELPTEDIQTDTIYLVPSDDPTTQDMYLEYMYINNQWELLGQKQIVVDLSNYVQFTDYANGTTGGVVKTGNRFSVSSSGIPSCAERTYAQYQTDANGSFISKGTLENVITGKGLTTKSYVDGLVGDINTAIDTINGEVI